MNWKKELENQINYYFRVEFVNVVKISPLFLIMDDALISGMAVAHDQNEFVHIYGLYLTNPSVSHSRVPGTIWYNEMSNDIYRMMYDVCCWSLKLDPKYIIEVTTSTHQSACHHENDIPSTLFDERLRLQSPLIF